MSRRRCVFGLLAVASALALMVGEPASPGRLVTRASSLVERLEIFTAAPLRSSPGDTPWMVATRHGQPARWTCGGAPITWAVSSSAPVPSGGVATIREAFARIAAVSGLRFVYIGSTTAAPTSSWRPVPGGSHVVIGWEPRDPLLRLAGEPANAVAMTQTLNEGGRLVGAVVDFEPAFWRTAAPGFGTGVTRGELALHELEHVVGLGDQRRWPGDLSYQEMLPRPAARFGAGDLAGLRRLGC